MNGISERALRELLLVIKDSVDPPDDLVVCLVSVLPWVLDAKDVVDL